MLREQRCDIYIVKQGKVIFHDYNIIIKKVKGDNNYVRRDKHIKGHKQFRKSDK